MVLSNAELQKSLERHNDAFESLLKLIPARYYIPLDDSSEAAGSRFQKHKKAGKEESQKAKRAKVCLLHILQDVSVLTMLGSWTLLTIKQSWIFKMLKANGKQPLMTTRKML